MPCFTLSEETTTTITLPEQILLVNNGAKVTIKAIVEPAKEANNIVWETSDSNIATVKNGVVQGGNPGKCTISCSLADSIATCEVEVIVPLKKITINEAEVTLLADPDSASSKAQLTYSLSPEDAYYKDVEWASSNEKVAIVDENGVVEGLTAGKAFITAKSVAPSTPPITAKVEVNVLQPVKEISIKDDSLKLPIKKTATLKVDIQPQNASVKKVNWNSSDENVISVSATGVVTAVAQGTATVIATTTDGTELSASLTVEVVNPVKKITTKDQKVTLAPGTTWVQEITISPEDATCQDIVWESSKENVAIVTEDGVILGIAPGQSKITGTAVDGSKVFVSIPVTVKNFDVVITTPDGAKIEYSMPNGIWGIGFKSSKQCVTDTTNFLKPLKVGEDVFTISMQNYMTRKIKKEKYSVYVAQSAVNPELSIQYIQCVLCNESYLKADMVELEDDSMVCRKCYESHDITFCGSCERLCVDENMTRFDDLDLCPECYAEYVADMEEKMGSNSDNNSDIVTCPKCGNLFMVSEMVEQADGTSLCYNCDKLK